MRTYKFQVEVILKNGLSGHLNITSRTEKSYCDVFKEVVEQVFSDSLIRLVVSVRFIEVV